MTKTLYEQIAQRKQQAEAKKLNEKATYIAEVRGSKSWGKELSQNNHETLTIAYVFNNAAAELVIRENVVIDRDLGGDRNSDDNPYKIYNDKHTGSEVSITYKGLEVFLGKTTFDKNTGARIKSIEGYIPGVWEKSLNATYQDMKAEVAVAYDHLDRKIAQKKTGADQAKRKPWGL